MQHGNDSDRLSDESLVHQHSLVDDPSPRHLSVIVTGDDLSTTGDFSKVSIQNCPELIQNLPEIPTFKRRVSIHRRAKSWDSSYSHRRDTNNKTSCFQVTSSFFRRQKVIPADRSELYEHAKTILNTGNYQQALEMFQTLQTAQQKRFGKAHFTVAAAMHNVGVVRLRMGQPKDAEQILTEAVAIRRKVLGNDQLDLAVSLKSICFRCRLSRVPDPQNFDSSRETNRSLWEN
jgi:tetratricopeptide (TPR) repeat protein